MEGPYRPGDVGRPFGSGHSRDGARSLSSASPDHESRTTRVGLAQCLAMWPGVSRSLATIIGGLFLGLSMQTTVEFSFLLGAVTLTAASVYDVIKHGSEMLAVLEIRSMLLGLVFAFAAAVLSVKWMIAYLNKYGLEIFGYYRIALAIIAWFIYAI